MEENKNQGNEEVTPSEGVNQEEIKKNVETILNTAVEVIKNPMGFFASMKKDGGFKDPLIFMAAMGVVTGCVRVILSIFGLGYTSSFVTALFSIVVVPVFLVVVGFLAAALFYILWKIMGSKESYETAYRCVAYASAITPIVTLISPIPYIGVIAGNVWSMYVMVTASIGAHAIENKKAWIVFGILCLVLCISAVNAERAAKEMTAKMEKWEQEFGDMSPEEAGKVFGDFLKGVEQSKQGT
ncbi:MAG: YIP1 family protein [Candidatus Omnitrophica bacterium]|nr:YIP1 family protein [Candidatus Omnitrophota bacterium]